MGFNPNWKIQLTLEHEFELHGSTYTGIFYSEYYKYVLSYDFLKTFSLAYSIVSMRM